MKEWREPYLAGRRATGWGLYNLVGVSKGDREGARRQLDRNFVFFDAPVGLIITLDRDLELGSWADLGTFLQNIMVAARGHGLHTCPQAAFMDYHKIIRAELGVSEREIVICGMASATKTRASPRTACGWSARRSMSLSASSASEPIRNLRLRSANGWSRCHSAGAQGGRAPVVG